MKKLLIWLSVGVLAFGMAGCGSQGTEDNDGGSQTQEPAAPSDTPTEEPDQDVPTDGSIADSPDYPQGWTGDMETVRTAVTDLLGDNYFPDQALDPEALEFVFGITSDMYDDYFAEMPMISTNVDTLVVVKAAEGQADAVEEKLNSYRDKKISGTMEYPQNVGKIQASKVEKFDDYVVFAMLGGNVMDLLDQGDEAVITHCQEINDSVIEAIKGLVQ